MIRASLTQICLLVLSLLLAFCAASPACAFVFFWPDARTHPRVILNADQGLGDYFTAHPDWFKNDFLVAGGYITNVPYGDYEGAVNSLLFIRHMLRYRNIFTGTYVSGTTAIHEPSVSTFPANAVSIEDMSVKVHYLGSWMREPVQQVVDIKDPLSRYSLQQGIRMAWRHDPALMRFVDNAAVHPMVAASQPWASYCQNMKELRAMAEKDNSNVVFTVFARPWQFSNLEIGQLVDAVRGNGGNAVALPLPWSKTIKDDKTANAWAIFRYRQLLASGVVVILIPPADPKTDGTIDDLIAWVSTWKQPYDRVYYAFPYWEEPPL